MASNKIIVYTDGGSRGNPGAAAIGLVIQNTEGGLIKEYSKTIGEATNNEAEYEAVIFALQKLKQLLGKERAKETEIEIRTDSELVFHQLNGDYKIEEPRFFPFFIKIHNLKIDFGKIAFSHIPRSENKRADRLLNESLGFKGTQKLFNNW